MKSSSAIRPFPMKNRRKLLDYCQGEQYCLSIFPPLQTSRFCHSCLRGTFIEAEHTPLDGWGKILKRAFDIAASVVLIVAVLADCAGCRDTDQIPKIRMAR